MEIGAVVAAANYTDRVRSINSFDEIEAMSTPERIVALLKKCGIDNIVVVTGYDSAVMKKKMRHFGLCFVENSLYDVTDAMVSAKLGLKQIYEQCEKLVYCPSGYPFFKEETVETLLSAGGDVVIPSYNGKKGHPVVIDTKIVPELLSYTGNKGMKEALELATDNISVVTVDDYGCTLCNDDEDEIRKLIREQNKTLVRQDIDISLVGTRTIIDRQMKQLLIQIDSLGSVREACEKVGISYSKGWNLIKDSESELGFRLVDRQNGGRFGGAASLSTEGMLILDRYRAYEDAVSRFAEEKFDEYFKHILVK